MMELKQLKAILAIYEYGSFTAAAEALETVQSNISAHVSKLEAELNTVLVDRSTGQITPAGRIVVDCAKQVNVDIENIPKALATFEDKITGIIKIGLIGTTASWLVPWLFQQIPKRWQLLKPQYTEGTSFGLEQELLEGYLDLIITNLPTSSAEIISSPLFTEDLVLVVGTDHHLAKKRTIGMKDLEDIELLLPAPGTVLRTEINSAAKKAGANLSSRADIDSIRLIASLTFAGFGPAILPSTSISDYLTNRWVGIKIADLSPRTVGIARRNEPLITPSITAIIKLLDTDLIAYRRLPKGINVLPIKPMLLQRQSKNRPVKNKNEDSLPPE